jgi:hypothetical protein
MTHNMYNLPSTLQRLLCTLKLLSITPLLLLCCIAFVKLYFTYPVVRSNDLYLVFHVDTIGPRRHMSVSSFNKTIIDYLCTTAELQPSTRQSLDATLDREATETNQTRLDKAAIFHMPRNKSPSSSGLKECPFNQLSRSLPSIFKPRSCGKQRGKAARETPSMPGCPSPATTQERENARSVAEEVETDNNYHGKDSHSICRVAGLETRAFRSSRVVCIRGPPSTSRLPLHVVCISNTSLPR